MLEEKVILEIDPSNESHLIELIQNHETYMPTILKLITELWAVKRKYAPHYYFNHEDELYIAKA